MNSILALTIILAILMMIFGGKRGISSFFSVVFNFIILFVAVLMMGSGISPIFVALFAGICIIAITIYMSDNDEKTSNLAFESTLLTLLISLVIIIPIVHLAQLKGFSNEQSEEIEAFNLLVGVNFEQLAIATAVLSTLGAVAEAAIAIASGLQEVIEQNPRITHSQLRLSGRNIGFQILGMTFNTLFFGMFGSDLALFVLLAKIKESISHYLNSKIFVFESMLVLFSAIAVLIVIWLTIYLVNRNLKTNDMI